MLLSVETFISRLSLTPSSAFSYRLLFSVWKQPPGPTPSGVYASAGAKMLYRCAAASPALPVTRGQRVEQEGWRRQREGMSHCNGAQEDIKLPHGPLKASESPRRSALQCGCDSSVLVGVCYQLLKLARGFCACNV
ncbi:hypothetical protein CRENBAI_009969 [Crenichthys baileyi]|uniref:Uncharacterized protein n=1 Tax=Crenichthys baileyi TaxID=28760 RepID=A0AAV9S0W7_9TELE